MATITIPDTSSVVPGLVAQGDDTISANDVALITGSEPAILQTDHTVAASQNIPAYTPVGFDANGDLVPAVLGGGTPIQAVGITIIAVVTPGSGAKKAVPIYRAGCFNPAKLNWSASYDTPLKKRNAFNDAPTPTAIVIREIKTATVS